jgi:dipeptidyl aminopeptidase/acylaminoacyl peptidase
MILIKFAAVCCCLAFLPAYAEVYPVKGESFLNHDIIALAVDVETILERDKPVISVDGKNVAWTVRKKPPEQYFDSAKLTEWDIPPSYTGAKILLKKEGEEAATVSPLGSSSWCPSWSTDGKQLAFYSYSDGKTSLWIYDLEQLSSRKLWENPVKAPFGSAKITWSSTQHEVYVLGCAESEGTTETLNPSFSHFRTKDKAQSRNIPVSSNRIFAINTDTGAFRSLLPEDNRSHISALSVSPSSRWISYVSSKWNQDPTLNLHGTIEDLNILSTDGKTQLTIAPSIEKGYEYELKLLWHPTSDILYFLDKQKVWKAVFSNEGLLSCEPIQALPMSIDQSTFGLTRDGNKLIAGLDAIQTYDYSINRPTKLALIALDGTDGQSYALPENWRFVSLILNKKGVVAEPSSDVIAFIAEKMSDVSIKGILLLNLSTGSVETVWEGHACLSPIDLSPDHQRFFTFYEDFATPQGIYTYDFQLSMFQALSRPEQAFAGQPVGSFHLIESQLPDQEGKIETVLTGLILPPGAKLEDRIPAIVVHYPGANCAPKIGRFGGGEFMGGLPQWILTNHGFAVILPNLVMGEKAIGKPLQTMTDRLIPQVKRIAQLGYIDMNRVGIMGQSYGGYGTVGIISHTDLFRAAVAINGVYDLASFSYHLDPDGTNFWLTWAEASQGNMGMCLFDDPKRYMDNSPFYRANTIHTPLLLIHGQLDSAFEDAGKMFSALRRLNRSAELVTYRYGWHVFREMRREDHIHAIEQILSYFHDHL